jgi:hypothetical protein
MKNFILQTRSLHNLGSRTFTSSCKPVVVYNNADTDKVKILSDNLNKTGVYRWTNKINGKTYVGSAINLGKRLGNYYSYIIISKEKRTISRALLKHGYSNFEFEILEYCKINNVIEREQYYLDLLKPEYNILKIAGSSFGYKHTVESLAKRSGQNHVFFGRAHTEEAKAKIGAVHRGKIVSEETKERIRAARIGKAHSEATRVKLSIAKEGQKNPMYGKITSKETKTKLSTANGSPVQVLNTKTNETKLYTSRRAAAIALSCDVTTVSRYIKSDKLYTRGEGIFKITGVSNK